MMSDGGIQVVYRTVVGERIADPMTPGITASKIAIAVIDPTVEADRGTPVSGMKDEDGAG
jgi:hypothetical protein